MVGESKTDSAVRTAPAGIRGLDDLDLCRRNTHLCTGRHGQTHGRESDQNIAKHCVFLPSLRRGILRVIVVVFFAGLAAVEGYADPLF